MRLSEMRQILTDFSFHLLHKGVGLAYNLNMVDTVLFTLPHFVLFAQRTSPKKPGGAFDMNTVIMLILGAGIIAILSVIAYYVGSRLRKGALEREQPPPLSDHLKTFQEATEEGNMSAKEYALVKRHLAQKIMDEVKSDVGLQTPDFRLREEALNDTPEAHRIADLSTGPKPAGGTNDLR